MNEPTETTIIKAAEITKNNLLFVLKCIFEVILYAVTPYFVIGFILVVLYFALGLSLEQMVLSFIMLSLLSCFFTIVYLVKRVG